MPFLEIPSKGLFFEMGEENTVHKLFLIILGVFVNLTGQLTYATTTTSLTDDVVLSEKGVSSFGSSINYEALDNELPTPNRKKNPESPVKLEDVALKRPKIEEAELSKHAYQFPLEHSAIEVVSIPEERGIWCQNLDYQYDDHEIVSTHQWHTQSAMIVKKHIDEHKDEQINFAKARIDALLRIADGITQLVTFDIPYIFTSKSLGKNGFLSFAEVSNDNSSPSNPIDVNSFIGGLQGQDLTACEEDLRKEYYHTELAILFYALIQDDWIKHIKTSSEIDINLECLVFVISTYYDPCARCAKSLHRAQIKDGYYWNLIRQRCSEQGLCEGKQNLTLFMEASSLEEYEGSRKCLDHKDSTLYANNINIREFFPYFAQMSLNIRPLKHPRPMYASKAVIRSKVSREEEDRILAAAKIEGDLKTEAIIKFKRLFNGDLDIKKELSEIDTNLIDLDHLSARPNEEEIKSEAETFCRSFSDAKKDEPKQQQILDPELVLLYLTTILSKDANPQDMKDIKDAISKEKDKSSTLQSIPDRIGIIGKYCNPQKSSADGKGKISQSTIDAANLLKIYGYIHWSDPVSDSKDIPLKLNKSATRASKNHAENIIDTLNDIIKKYVEGSKLRKTADFLLKKVEEGYFERVSGKYHWFLKK